MLQEWPDILTVKDIKKILHIGTNKAYELAKQLPHMPIGSQIRINKADLIEYLNNSKQSK